ncbi:MULTISPECIES: hypothetical protein [unclassified Microbacterium]|uniref:hypothetical protein n=1 Tax=unclassified Microbacterium TaxID=2609290 RepID=UPI003015B48F
MRTRWGAHLAGLLAAAGFPLDDGDLARLTGRPVARVRALLPAATTTDLVVHEIAAGAETGDATGRSWELSGAAALARVVRNLHAGPLPDGADADPAVQARALAPFRTALHAAARAAREDWGWSEAPAFTLSPDFPRSMQGRPRERRALIELVTDAARARALDERDPDAARQQLDEATASVAGGARSPGDLVDLARLLVAGSGWDPTGGAVPRRLAPVFALLGDTERAVALAEGVRTEPAIELAYVARAAAQAGDPAAVRLLDEALDRLGDAPRGALLRTAQAVAGTAVFLEADAARRAAASARDLVERAFTDASGPDAVEGLRARQFSSSRDEEWSLAARTLATCAVARARAGLVTATDRTIREVHGVIAEIVDPVRRAVAAADVAARLAEPSGRDAVAAARAVLDEGIAVAAEEALACPDDVIALGEIARLLSGRTLPDGDTPETPVADAERARRAVERALALAAADGTPPPRGLLRDAAALLGLAATVPAALAAVEAVADARHGTPLERRTRARAEAVALADAAAVLSAAGDAAGARSAARGALDAVGRVPAAARARWLAEVATALLDTDVDDVFALGVEAAEAERAGSEGRWDATAPTLLADALLTAPETDPRHDEERARILADAVAALRRAERAAALTALADRAARGDDPERARRLASFALRAAHVVDPVRRERAAAALRASTARHTAGPDGGSASTDALPGSSLDIAAVAAAWRADGYPGRELARFTAAHPAAGRRVRGLIRADLDR